MNLYMYGFEIEFYVGSIMAVTVSDSCSPHPNKLSRFVGICIGKIDCELEWGLKLV